MPLHVARLRDSDLAAEADPEACWYAVMLWAASWHQLPAASLPDNEAVLARLCGLGRDVKTFRKHRAAAMRGFVLCDDGRWYHPVVAEAANSAWEEKAAYRDRKAQRAQIAKKAAAARWGEHAGSDASGMHDASNDHASCIADAMPKGRGRGRGIKEEDADASFVGSVDPTLLAELLATVALFAERSARHAVKRRTYPAAFEAAWRAYPHHVNRSSKPDSLTQWRKLPQDERDGLADACQRFRAKVSETCGGKGAPDMARWLRAGKHLNWIQQAQPAVAKAWDGPDAVRAAIALQIREGFAASYVDTSRWRPEPPTIIAPNEFMAGKLRKEAGEVLERLGVRVEVAEGRAA
ncbi:MAG: DUF1376 domain-containing protein [Caulobacter sp.]|nr:DUF1376 domain-containing protein [Caulobacter sp.]